MTDVNHDRRPDFVVTVNNSIPKTFLNETKNEFSRVRLIAPESSPSVIGSKITFTLDDGSILVRHIVGGGSYLSQSSEELFVAGKIKSAKVRWPDGEETSHDSIVAGDDGIKLQR